MAQCSDVVRTRRSSQIARDLARPVTPRDRGGLHDAPRGDPTPHTGSRAEVVTVNDPTHLTRLDVLTRTVSTTILHDNVKQVSASDSDVPPRESVVSARGLPLCGVTLSPGMRPSGRLRSRADVGTPSTTTRRSSGTWIRRSAPTSEAAVSGGSVSGGSDSDGSGRTCNSRRSPSTPAARCGRRWSTTAYASPPRADSADPHTVASHGTDGLGYTSNGLVAPYDGRRTRTTPTPPPP